RAEQASRETKNSKAGAGFPAPPWSFLGGSSAGFSLGVLRQASKSQKPQAEACATGASIEREGLRGVGIVVQIGGEPALDDAQIEAFTAAVILDLVAADFSDGEIFRCGVRKVKAAYRSRRIHREIFRQRDARVFFRAQEIEE